MKINAALRLVANPLIAPPKSFSTENEHELGERQAGRRKSEETAPKPEKPVTNAAFRLAANDLYDGNYDPRAPILYTENEDPQTYYETMSSEAEEVDADMDPLNLWNNAQQPMGPG